MFKYVLFDLDGTLTDSSEGITKSVQYALMQQGIMEPDLKKLYRFIGPPLPYSFMTYYGMDKEHSERALVDFRKRYEPVGIKENKLYPGIEDLLASLKSEGIKLLVASSKPEVFVYQVLENFNIKCYFDVIIGTPPDESGMSKEDVIEYALWTLMRIEDGEDIPMERPRDFSEIKELPSRKELMDAMRAHGIDASVCAMVGDRHFDMVAAKQYEIYAVGVRHGFAEKGELEAAGADTIAENSEELLYILKGKSFSDVKKN